MIKFKSALIKCVMLYRNKTLSTAKSTHLEEVWICVTHNKIKHYIIFYKSINEI